MAANQIPYDGQASVNGGQVSTWKPQGALDKTVVQSVQYSNDLGRPECDVTLKGPYPGLTEAAYAVGSATSATTWSEFKQTLAAKGCPLDAGLDPMGPYEGLSATYPVISYRLEQGRDGAGVHGTLTLTLGVFDGGGGGGGGEEYPNSEVWGVSWQPESWDVYRYCKNAGLSSLPALPEGQAYPTTYTADSVHIQQYLDQSQDTAGAQTRFQYSSVADGQMYVLNYPEQLIAKKKLAGLQPVFHYPIVTKSKTSVKSGGLPTISGLGAGIDVALSSPPPGCPFTFPESPWGTAWSWIKTGDTVNMSRDKNTGTTTYTRTETWNGAVSPDVNFYGTGAFDHNNLETCRWKFGEL